MKKKLRPDYHWTYSKGLNKEQRKELNIGDIWINGAVCLKCKDFIRSKNIHDYCVCRCGAIAVDGGSWYCKRQGNPDDMIDVIELFEEEENE